MRFFLNFLWPQKELASLEARDSKFIESKLQFWTLIGPLFLFLIFFLVLSSNELLLATCLTSLFLCWKFGKNGLFISLGLLLLSMILSHISLSNHLWQLGIEAYVGLAIFMTYLGFEETFKLEGGYRKAIKENQAIRKEEQAQFAIQVNCLQKEIESLKEQIKNKSESLSSVSDKLQSLRKLNDILCNSKELNEEIKRELELKIRNQNETIFRLQEQINNKIKELGLLKDSAALKKRNLELLNALNKTRVEKHQAHLINEALAQYYSQKMDSKIEPAEKPKESPAEKLKEGKIPEAPKSAAADKKINTIKVFEDKDIYYRKVETDFSQLRKQFDEKNEVLYLTRREVFNLQTQVNCLQNAIEEKELEVPAEEKHLLQIIQKLEHNCTSLEGENKKLEEFCQALLDEK